jgi:hypothetical protein
MRDDGKNDPLYWAACITASKLVKPIQRLLIAPLAKFESRYRHTTQNRRLTWVLERVSPEPNL